MSVSYEALSDYIVSIRQRVCPRTSYATSGSAASIAFALIASHYHEQFMQLSALLKRSGEFQQVEIVVNKEELLHKVNGNLVIIFGEGNSSSNVLVDELLAKGKTKLVIYILPNKDNDEIMAKLKGSEMFSKISQKFDCAEALSCFQYRKVRNAGPPTKAFNNQPSVQSGMQFRFLWSPSTPQAEGGKDRVLQRLADKNLADGRKLSAPEWDRMVRAALDHNLDDYGVYNMIRERTLGSSLAKDLEEQVRGAPTKSSTADSGKDVEEGAGGEDGRATHMMSRTLDSIPERLRQPASTAYPAGLRCMLDYGCAEGAITAALGKQLGLVPSRILGADVRAIPSVGFTFIPLPAEEDSVPPPLGTILPSVPSQSVDLITAAMVFHHVTHVKAALLELRRIISPTGALVIREHHCASADMGAFLDITHGLYSLAWSKPVEWPDFISEYKAFYRSQEAWDALAQECGFTLSLSAPQAQRNYRAAEFAQRKANGFFPNVIKAYYAVYTPNPQFVLPPVVVPRPIATNSAISSCSGAAKNNSNARMEQVGIEESSTTGTHKRRASEVAEEPQRDERKRPKESGGAGEREELIQSSKYPGRFYRINKATGVAEWTLL